MKHIHIGTAAAAVLAIAGLTGIICYARGETAGTATGREDGRFEGTLTALGVKAPHFRRCLDGVTKATITAALEQGLPVGNFCRFEAIDGRGELPPLFRRPQTATADAVDR